MALSRIDLAAWLLLLGSVRHYGWELWTPHGVAAKMLGGVAILGLLWTVYLIRQSRILLVVVAWWSYEELQVVICSAAYLARPWHVPPGKAMCSAYVGWDIGSLSVLTLAVIAFAVNVYSSRNAEGR